MMWSVHIAKVGGTDYADSEQVTLRCYRKIEPKVHLAP